VIHSQDLPSAKPKPVHDAFAWLRAHPLAANDPLRHIMLDVDGIIFPFHRAQASHLPGSPSPESIIDTWGAVKEKYPLAVHVAASGYAHSKAAILRFGLHPYLYSPRKRARAAYI
jgi:hypothetical protein